MDQLEIDGAGDLVLHTAREQIRHQKPSVYQQRDGVKQEIVGSYVLKGRPKVGFQVAAHDTSGLLLKEGLLSALPVIEVPATQKDW